MPPISIRTTMHSAPVVEPNIATEPRLIQAIAERSALRMEVLSAAGSSTSNCSEKVDLISPMRVAHSTRSTITSYSITPIWI